MLCSVNGFIWYLICYNAIVIFAKFSKREERLSIFSKSTGNSTYTRFDGLKLYWILKIKVFAPFFQTRYRMKPLTLHIIMQKTKYKYLNRYWFYRRWYLTRQLYSGFYVYDMTRTWLMEPLVHYRKNYLG